MQTRLRGDRWAPPPVQFDPPSAVRSEMDPDEVAAHHEAGHCICQIGASGQPPKRVYIHGRGNSSGGTLSVDRPDLRNQSQAVSDARVQAVAESIKPGVEARSRYRAWLIGMIGGELAERTAAPNDPEAHYAERCASDRRAIMTLVRAVCEDEEQRVATSTSWRARPTTS
jgi:hypothetical protein